MYVISGATGHTGKGAATKLLQAGKKVRALVRSADKAADLAKLGAEVVVVELGDREGLTRALGGASSAVKAAAVPHVVFLSSIGAQHASGTGIIQSVHGGEQALLGTGAATTFVRPGYFVENWGAVLPVAKKDGVLPSFIPGDFSMPMVSNADVGSLAAEALLDGPRGARVLELAGPRDVTPKDVAAVVSKILERPIQLVEAPLDAVVPTFTSFGISSDIAALYRQMYEGFIAGRVAYEGGKAVARRGTTSLEDTLRPMLAG